MHIPPKSLAIGIVSAAATVSVAAAATHVGGDQRPNPVVGAGSFLGAWGASSFAVKGGVMDKFMTSQGHPVSPNVRAAAAGVAISALGVALLTSALMPRD